MTIRILPRVVPTDLIDAVLRTIHHDIRGRGLTPEQMDAWDQVRCPWPHLRFDPSVLRLRDLVLALLSVPPNEVGEPCEPQIIWQWPDDQDRGTPPPHVDEPPPWANGRGYRRIAGVTLGAWGPENGGLRIWSSADGSGPHALRLPAGSVIDLPPDLPHATGVNRSGRVRAGLYFRWVEM